MAAVEGTRRVNGQGSTPFQRPGRKGWYSYVRATDPRTGEYRRMLVSAPTKTALAEKVRDSRDLIQRGHATATVRRVTVADYVSRWMAEHLAARDVTPSTRRLYRHCLENLVCPTVGGLRLDRVREADVRRVDQVLRDAGKSRSSRRLAYNVMRMLFADAVRDRLLMVNPVEGVERPSDPPTPQPHYTVAQLRTLQSAVAGERLLEPLVTLMMWTALRPGEALALRWDAVDLDAGLVTVGATLAQDEAGRVYRQEFAKGGRERARQPRPVPLVAPALDALRGVRRRQVGERLAVGEAWQDHGLVFCDELGGLLDDRNLRRRYAPLVKKAGLAGSFHSVRRSTANLLTEAGVPLGVVAEILGHSSTAITQAHYQVVDTRMMRAAFAGLETFWEATP